MREAAVRSAALALLALATLGARGVTRPTAPSTPVPLPSSVVLHRYAAALAALPRPKALSFEYTVEQLGLRNLEQTHRVYRSGRQERDETLLVDGYTLTRPEIRIFSNRTYRYDIASVAPSLSAYAFVFAGTVRASGGYGYVFRTAPRAPGPFAISELKIDGRTYLPSTLRFKIAGGGARGSGALQYARSEVYWVIREAQVNAHVTNGAIAHERIVWNNYQYPATLPASTFEAPRSLATATPSGTL